MNTQFVSYNQSQINYLSWGSGNKVLLCFHGFGESAETFHVFEPYLKNDYRILAIDLPNHGDTNWNGPLLFTIQDLVHIIDKIPAAAGQSFSLMGYSMGGRIALQLYEHIPQRILQLILIAPDGIKVSPWYWICTQVRAGNFLFRQVMKHPGFFFAVTRLLRKAGMINLGVYNYVHLHLKDERMRMKLYIIWTTMRKMKPKIPLVKSLIMEHKTKVVLVYGRFDRVIKYTTGERFAEGITQFCTLKVLDSGHRLLTTKNAAIVSELL